MASRGTKSSLFGLGLWVLNVFSSCLPRHRTLLGANPSLPLVRGAGDVSGLSRRLTGSGLFPDWVKEGKGGKKRKKKINSVYLFLNGEIK